MKLKTVIVDDDPVITFIHESIVVKSQLSSKPQVAFNGKEAMNLIENNIDKETVYLLLLDINMPVMNGWQFLELVKLSPYSQQIIVVLVTSSVDNADRKKAKQYEHVIDFIEKPMSIEICNKIKTMPEISNLVGG